MSQNNLNPRGIFVCNKEQHDSLLLTVSVWGSGFISGLLLCKMMSGSLKHCYIFGHLWGLHSTCLTVLGVIRHPFPKNAQTPGSQIVCLFRCHFPPRTLVGTDHFRLPRSRKVIPQCCSQAIQIPNWFLKKLVAISQTWRSHSFALTFPRADQEAYAEAGEIWW